MLNYIAAVFAFCILSIWCKEGLLILSGLLLAPRFGFRISRITVFNQHFTKQDGVWTRSTGKWSYVFQHNVSVDLSKPVPPDIDRKERILEGLRIGILLAVSLLVLILCRGSLHRCLTGTGSLPDWFLAGFSAGMFTHSIVSMCIRFYVYGVLMKRLTGYIQSLGKRLRAGERFCDLGLRPVEELPYKTYTEMETMFYYTYYLSAMLEAGNIGALHKPTHEMTNYFRNHDYTVSWTWNYYWLVFYYSRFELNPAAATHFLNAVHDTIMQDRDANAKRVLAYYAFGIEQDFPKARGLLNEAFACIDRFSVGDERELERRLLLELDGFLRQKGC